MEALTARRCDKNRESWWSDRWILESSLAATVLPWFPGTRHDLQAIKLERRLCLLELSPIVHKNILFWLATSEIRIWIMFSSFSSERLKSCAFLALKVVVSIWNWWIGYSCWISRWLDSLANWRSMSLLLISFNPLRSALSTILLYRFSKTKKPLNFLFPLRIFSALQILRRKVNFKINKQVWNLWLAE